MSRRRSSTVCVNVPSPDHFVASRSDGMVDGHQAAEHRIDLHLRESTRFEEARYAFGAGVASNGRWNVAVGVGIAMQHPPKRRADNGQVRSEEHTSELQSQSNLVCRLL